MSEGWREVDIKLDISWGNTWKLNLLQCVYKVHHALSILGACVGENERKLFIIFSNLFEFVVDGFWDCLPCAFFFSTQRRCLETSELMTHLISPNSKKNTFSNWLRTYFWVDGTSIETKGHYCQRRSQFLNLYLCVTEFVGYDKVQKNYSFVSFLKVIISCRFIRVIRSIHPLSLCQPARNNDLGELESQIGMT